MAVVAVQEAERSRHFAEVSKHLELGGTLYGYVDIDGDAAKLAQSIGGVLGQMATTQPQLAPFAQQDYPALFALLGLNDVKAIGLSSVPDGTGYFRNRAFLLAPERHGLMAALGGKPGPFARVGLAPADVDFYAESEVDLEEVYKAVKEVVAKIGGEESGNRMEAQLKKAGETVALSLHGLINGWKGHSAVLLRLDPEKTLRLPGQQTLVIPAPSLLFSFDGVAPAIEPALAKVPAFALQVEGGLKFYRLKAPLPLEGIAPVLVVEGTRLYVASSEAFLKECLQTTGRLADTAGFRNAVAALGAEGNSLTYVSPVFYDKLRNLERLNAHLPEDAKGPLRFVVAQLPKADRPMVAVRTNLPEGILFRSYWNRSLKQDIAAAAVYNPVSIGLLAAMAVPAFQKVRQASQEKAVLNNLRQLSAAFDQYCLETGKSTATYDDLVGPGKFIRRLTSVGGENYRNLTFEQGRPLQVLVPTLRKSVSYGP